MHSFAARIALLAYLVGGLAIPAAHWHGVGHPAGIHRHAASHSHAGHSSETHSYGETAAAEGVCCHAAPAKSAADAKGDDAAAEDVAGRTGVAATAPHGHGCGEDCVICSFAGSAQTLSAGGPGTFLSAPLRRFAADSPGPGFAAGILDVERLRGPPIHVISG